MSTVWTFQALSDKVRDDLDMQDELIVTQNEMFGYANAAVEEAQAEIMAIYEDYYLTKYDIPLVAGTAEYELPDGIYAEKIRGLVYVNGNVIYDVKRFRGSRKFSDIAQAQQFTNSADDYRYFLENPSVDDGYRVNLVPASRETGSSIRLWYIREAARFVDESDVLDIPQFSQFIIEFMKGMCKAKENGGQMPPDAAVMIEQKRKLMVDSLTRMIPDDDDELEKDLTPYTEMT